MLLREPLLGQEQWVELEVLEVPVLPHMPEALWVTIPTRLLVPMPAVLLQQQHHLEQPEELQVLVVVTQQVEQVAREQLASLEVLEAQVPLPMLEV